MKIRVYKGITAEVVPSGQKYMFYFLSIDGMIIIEVLEDLTCFVEIFSSFTSNYLELKTTYDFGKFSAKIVSKNGVLSLALKVENTVRYFNKFECKMVTSTLNRVIARVDIFKITGEPNPALIITEEGK